MATMAVADMLCEQLASARQQLAGMMATVDEGRAHWLPPGKAHPVGALYAHILLYEDLILRFLVQGQTPLFMAEWAGRVGVSELPPLPSAEAGVPDWSDWARTARFDLASLHVYGEAVLASSAATIAVLGEEDLVRTVDLGWLGLGQPSLRWVISRFVIGHADAHQGEISCVLGLQGLRGYAF